MANRVKEDEKNERIIRNLLKLPENRRCINCNSLGPQYVCTNFWTFVCTTCSGIHREFTHRVKSVSMAKFTSQEVASLQGGGNARAKEIFFKEWDSQRHSFPDSSNLEKLRDFIKHVFVDRRYTGERSFEKPPMVKKGEESYENRRVDTYQGGSRSPPYEDTYERRYIDRPSPGGRSDDSNFRYDEKRSPGYERENRQYGDNRRSPANPELVNDWRRDDRFGNGRRPEDRRISDGDSRSEGRSPDHQKDTGMSSPPIVRPVREILGDNVVPLRISEPPKANGFRAANDSAKTLRTASSSSLGSTDGNPVEPKRETLGSLIDFDADPEPPAAAVVPQMQQTTLNQSIAQPMSSSGDNNWASFDLATEAKVSQAPSSVNSLESVLLQLSGSPGHLTGVPSTGGAVMASPAANMSVLPSGHSPVAPVSHASISTFLGGVPPAVPGSNVSMTPPSGAPAAAPGFTSTLSIDGVNSFNKVNEAGQWPLMQQQQQHHSLFPTISVQSSAQQFTPTDGASTNQPWNSSLASSAHVPQAVSKSGQGVSPSSAAQPSPVEVKSSGRKALPEDLFASSFPSYSVPVPGWQTGPPGGMGFAVQYNTAALIPTFVQSSKSMNPFDFNNEQPPAQTPSFPSMASLQGALPNMPPSSGLLRTSSLGAPSSAWMPPQSPAYASALPPQAPTFPSALPPGAYMGQQIPNNVPPSRHQGVGGFGNEGAAFGSIYSNQLQAGGYSAPATPTSFPSVGGNPFG